MNCHTAAANWWVTPTHVASAPSPVKDKALTCSFSLRIHNRVGTLKRERLDTHTACAPCTPSPASHLGSIHAQTRGAERPTPLDTAILDARARVGMNRHSNRHTSPKRGASCVQSFDDSLDFAIRMTYRISLRSSSLWEPRHPLLKVLVVSFYSLARGLV